jgi:hypothetical protein
MAGNILSCEPFSTCFPDQLDFFTGIIGSIRETSLKLVPIHAVSYVPHVFTNGLLEKVLLALLKCGLHKTRQSLCEGSRRSAR